MSGVSSGGAYRKRSAQSLLPVPPRAGGPSLGLSRRSSIYGKGSSQPRQDPRPINDKNFQRECMMDLISYLTSHGYNAPISSKLPTGKEIKDIIEFLFRQVDPNIVMGKLEEMVPAFLKQLNYPFQISKSALYAAGSPHSWPGLLAALTWLVHMLNYTEHAREVRESWGSSGFKKNNSLSFFDFMSRSYTEFLHGNDEASAALEQSYRAQFEEEKARLIPELEAVKKRVADLQTSSQALNNEPSHLAVLEQKKKDLINDTSKFETLISNFQSHKDALQKKVEEKMQELEVSKVEITSVIEENENVKRQIEAQQISVAGVEKMDKESQVLDDNLEMITKVVKELEEDSWKNEVQCSKVLMEIEANEKSLIEAISRLRSILTDVEAEQSLKYDINMNYRGETLEEVFGRNVKGMFKPFCASLMDRVGKATREARDEIHSLQKKLYADEIVLQEKREKISLKEAQNKKLIGLYKSSKENLDKHISSKTDELAAFQAVIAKDENELQVAYGDAAVLLKKTQAENEATIKSCAEELKIMHSEIMRELEGYLEQKEFFELNLEKVEAAIALAAETVSDCNLGLQSLSQVMVEDDAIVTTDY